MRPAGWLSVFVPTRLPADLGRLLWAGEGLCLLLKPRLQMILVRAPSRPALLCYSSNHLQLGGAGCVHHVMPHTGQKWSHA